MPNGRCRCHGGKSTGPRTPEGQARSATANTKHGNTTAPNRIRQRHIRTLITRTRLKCQARLLWPYLPRDMANRLAEGPEELWAPIHPSNLPFVQPPAPPLETPDRRHLTQPGAPTRPLPRALAAERVAAQAETASQAPWRQAIAYARANKRDWLAFRRADRTERRAARAARRAARDHAASLAANPQALLPSPDTPWTDYTPFEKELAARLAGLRAHPSEPRHHPQSLTPTPDSSIPRIDPMNPEPPTTPAQNPESAHLRIYPMNPEPNAAPATSPSVATTRQHPQPPALSRSPTHQGQIAGDRPVAARDPDNQNAPARTGPAVTPTPDSAFPRINPMNPEPARTPTQNPNSTPRRIDPMNPEPPLRPRPTSTRSQALGTTTLAQAWDQAPHAQRFGHPTPALARQIPRALPPTGPRP
jgi:hypothetical protein